MNRFHPDFLGETAARIKLQSYPSVRQFVVQHLYPDTLRLLLLLHQYVPVHCVIGIGYSGKVEVMNALTGAGIRVLTPDYDELEHCVRSELGLTLKACREQDFSLLIHEVGGYAIKCLHADFPEDIDIVRGAMEVTKQGVWVAEQLPDLKIPQVNCAQTRLKQVEGKMVGEAVVTALDVILREIGFSTVGREALVLGYGWVGKGTAVSLRNRGLQVSVLDTDIIQCVDATVDGFSVPRTADYTHAQHPRWAIVVGTSGQQSINAKLIATLPDRCFLVSGSSKDHEIDLRYLQDISVSTSPVHPYVEAIITQDGRTLFLVNSGFPVNFTGASVPDEIVEFLFAELIMLVPWLLDNTLTPGIYPLPEEQEKIAAEVWLDLR
ncbi:MAG: hypothetical protein KTR32_36800 [Granulosicoccus sp.]|nr:hypothetical protein [Granulosicoccus sp.]